eukprot:4587355-Alexandrium_andersonii.AAC.1
MGSFGVTPSPAAPPEEAAWPLSLGGNGGVLRGSGGKAGTGGRTRRSPAAWVDAVSYTHLRAHETSAHL